MRAMIVDDEQFVRTGIIRNIDWAAYGIDEVLEARNGMEGLRKLGAQTLDILITDIKMPKMDGISLALKGIALYPELKIIFISAYSDKEYLKSAISLSVTAYVEKPIILDELRAAIQKAVSSIEAAQARMSETRTRNTLRRLMTATSEQDVSAANQSDGGHYCVGVIRYKNAQQIALHSVGSSMAQLFDEAGVKSWIFGDILKTDYVVVVEAAELDKPSVEAIFKRCIENVSEKSVFISMSRADAGLASIRTAYEKAVDGMRLLFFRGFGTLVEQFEKVEAKPFVMEQILLNQFKGALSNRIKSLYDEALQDFLKQVSGGSVTEHSVRKAFYQLFEIIANVAPDHGVPSMWQCIMECTTIFDLVAMINAEAEKIFGHSAVKDKTVIGALSVITREYANQNLSIGYICDRLNVSKSKLCSVFRAQTGMTINEYISSYRIWIAQEMMAKEDISLGEVARLVGYNGLNYFSKAFKKQTGLVPSVYKEQME